MQKLIKNIGYEFKNKELLTMALTHSSFANESKSNSQSYERLEFLGDSILSFVVSTNIYEKFTTLPEGAMSKLRAAIVCERSLEECAKAINIGEYLILSKGEELTGGRQRPSILADVFEAILAAIYLDGGIEPAKKFVITHLKDTLEKAQSGKGIFNDYKTALQEMMQRDDNNVEYVHIKEEGPEHNKIFTVEINFMGVKLASGSGRSKKEAEQNAAKKAINNINSEKI